MFPNWQQYFNDPANRREGPATAREAAKDALRSFVGWSIENLPFQIRAVEGWDAHICSRQEGPNEDQPQELKPGQIAITRLQDRPCLAIFELAELIAEIRREEGQEPEDAPRPRCAFCGAVLDNKPIGRDRLYCDNKGKCKVAHHRKLQREQERAAILEQTALRDTWEQHHIGGQLLALLQDILLQQGEEAAAAHTEAVLLYTSDQGKPQLDEPEPEQPARTDTGTTKQRDTLSTQQQQERVKPFLEVDRTHPFEMRVLVYRGHGAGQEPDTAGIWLEQVRGANENAILSVAKAWFKMWEEPCLIVKHEEDGSERQLFAYPLPPRNQSYESYCKQLRLAHIKGLVAAAAERQRVEEEEEEEEEDDQGEEENEDEDDQDTPAAAADQPQP
jgi:hypothetical protein